MSIEERLFAGIFPTGLFIADRGVDEGGDYKRLAFVLYRNLELVFCDDCPPAFRESITTRAKVFIDQQRERQREDAEAERQHQAFMQRTYAGR